VTLGTTENVSGPLRDTLHAGSSLRVVTWNIERGLLKSADMIVLNEVDWGLKRAGYRAVVQELGNALNMNWAYGVEFTLANSNQRDVKGFATTFQFERALEVVGKVKLDWIFVKAYLASPRDDNGRYRFAPRFARTLGSINYALPTRLSDHDPISVDLPFGEHRDR
jgi:hypothetical protein